MRGRLVLVLATLGAVLLVGAAAEVAVERWLTAPIHDGDAITILLLGSDEGPMRNSDPLRGRADSFSFVSVSADRQHATFVNFPRDSYVTIPGRGGDRLAHCLVNGPDACVATMEANWDVRVDGYILTDFNGFKQAIHRFGGVELDVQHTTFDGGTAVTQTGVQRITGSQALSYTRDRSNRPGGDFGRATAQAQVLRAAHREVVERDATPARIAEIVAILQQTTDTDLSTSELLRLGFVARALEPANVDQVTLSGAGTSIRGMSVIQLSGESNAIVRDVAADGRR
jgi:polyisoprenyl-teichoic acid--peptidoglycan teichoic acid transferase